MVYKYHGFGYKVDAQIVGEEIEKIEAEKGVVTAKDIVDRARPKNSPIHDLFEWDNKIAAEKWRLHTATQVLCCLVKTDEDDTPQKAYVNIEVKEGSKIGIFANIKKAMSDAQTREVVLRNALNELQAFKAKYNHLAELAAVFEAIDKISA